VAEVTVLTGCIQRVDAVFSIGDVDVIDGRVSFASDYLPESSSKSLFWFPDRTHLSSVYANEASYLKAGKAIHEAIDVVNAELNAVHFLPIRLNAKSLQPATAFLLPKDLAANSTFLVPLFLRMDCIPPSPEGSSGDRMLPPNSSLSPSLPLSLLPPPPPASATAAATKSTTTARKVSITIKVEYIPKGMLKSFVSKEFSLPISFVNPMEVAVTFSSPDSMSVHSSSGEGILEPVLLHAGRHCVMKTTLRCTHSSRREIDILSNRAVLSSSACMAVTKPLGQGNTTKRVGASHLIAIQSHGKGSRAAFHKDECISKAYLLRATAVSEEKVEEEEEALTPPLFTSAEGGSATYVREEDGRAVSQYDIPLSVVGDVVVRFRSKQPHILRAPPTRRTMCYEGGNTDWLLHFPPNEEEPLERSISTTTTCEVRFPLPPFQV
jgi:hypothetical protein